MKSVCGVGINDADYAVTQYENGIQVWMCPFYETWKSMLVRCYSEKFQTYRPTYKGVTVVKEWHVFSTFKAWMEKQDWEGKQLDKDLLQGDVYSPETCLFISRELNTFMTERTRFAGELPTGVSRKGKKFCSRVNIPDGGREFLGVFDDPEQAHSAWKSRKLSLALDYFSPHHTESVIEALKLKYGGSI